MGRCRPLGSLRWFLMHLSCLGPTLFPCSPCFLHPPSSSAITVGTAASAGSQFGESSSTFGGQKSLMAVKCPVYEYARRYFHFTDSRPLSSLQLNFSYLLSTHRSFLEYVPQMLFLICIFNKNTPRNFRNILILKNINLLTGVQQNSD